MEHKCKDHVNNSEGSQRGCRNVQAELLDIDVQAGFKTIDTGVICP